MVSLISLCESFGVIDGDRLLHIGQVINLWLHFADLKAASGGNICLAQVECEMTAVAFSRRLH